MKLLTTSNTKIKKGETYGYVTNGIHLSPSTKSGYNTCRWSSIGCAASCLDTSGLGIMSNVQASRIKKTQFFFRDKVAFMTLLLKEVRAAVKSAEKKGMIPCFRFNLTSDLPWEKIKIEGKSIMEHFPTCQFYDYTKGVDRMSAFLAGEFPPNYHLTFSRSEDNEALVDAVLASGGNVAAVFRGSLPTTWKGKPVVSGDESDLRFLDPKGVIVGLVEKGMAKKDETGFVIEP
jgi:hypothetical protein